MHLYSHLVILQESCHEVSQVHISTRQGHFQIKEVPNNYQKLLRKGLYLDPEIQQNTWLQVHYYSKTFKRNMLEIMHVICMDTYRCLMKTKNPSLEVEMTKYLKPNITAEREKWQQIIYLMNLVSFSTVGMSAYRLPLPQI